MKKRNFIVSFLLACGMSTTVSAQTALYPDAFPLGDVTLLDGPLKHARDLNVNVLLQYDVDRLLAFDFPEDDAVLDMKDEYMFGDFLVCPVTHPIKESATRKVYLPKGALWINYWTGKQEEGGKWIDCQSEISTLPLFVKAGSIIPTTEVAEYTNAQIGKPITINVYPGADCEFTIYEDEGDNYNYEKGAFSTIPLSWNDKKNTLTIGQREGSFEGMLSEQTIIVKTPKGEKTITYKGKKVSVKL